MKKEAIRNYYVPKFILDNFCIENTDKFNYFDKKTSIVYEKKTNEVFLSKNLDFENSIVSLEKEISDILKSGFYNNDDIVLSEEDYQKLIVFFTILGFRAKNAEAQYGTKKTKDAKKFFKLYEEDGSMAPLWRKNLSALSECRSIKEIEESEKIDKSVKEFISRDVFGYFGNYLVVAKCKDFANLFIGDAYPSIVNGLLKSGLPLHLYSVFPISPERVVMIASKGIEEAPANILSIRHLIFNQPSVTDDGKIKIRVRGLYAEEVKYLNEMTIENSSAGFVFKSNEDKPEDEKAKK